MPLLPCTLSFERQWSGPSDGDLTVHADRSWLLNLSSKLPAPTVLEHAPPPTDHLWPSLLVYPLSGLCPQWWFRRTAWPGPQAVSCITAALRLTALAPLDRFLSQEHTKTSAFLKLQVLVVWCLLLFYPPLLRIICLTGWLWMAYFLATMMVAAECRLEDVGSQLLYFVADLVPPFYIARGQQAPKHNSKAYRFELCGLVYSEVFLSYCKLFTLPVWQDICQRLPCLLRWNASSVVFSLLFWGQFPCIELMWQNCISIHHVSCSVGICMHICSK